MSMLEDDAGMGKGRCFSFSFSEVLLTLNLHSRDSEACQRCPCVDPSCMFPKINVLDLSQRCRKPWRINFFAVPGIYCPGSEFNPTGWVSLRPLPISKFHPRATSVPIILTSHGSQLFSRKIFVV